MKRFITVFVLVGIVAVFGLVTLVSAQESNPPVPPVPDQGFGRWGGMGMMGEAGQYGPMHEYMEETIAQALGLTVEELEERHAAGETFWQISEAQGYTPEEARQLMLDARGAALDKMVEDGVISPEQADWMKDRSSRMYGGGFGHGQGGCMGGGFNQDGTQFRRGGRGSRWSQDG